MCQSVQIAINDQTKFLNDAVEPIHNISTDDSRFSLWILTPNKILTSPDKEYVYEVQSPPSPESPQDFPPSTSQPTSWRHIVNVMTSSTIAMTSPIRTVLWCVRRKLRWYRRYSNHDRVKDRRFECCVMEVERWTVILGVSPPILAIHILICIYGIHSTSERLNF